MTPYRAYDKALTLGLRIPELEPVILKDAYWSYRYARYVIKGRLPDFMHNAVLLSNDEFAKYYIEYIK